MGVLRIGPSALEGVGVRRVAMEMGQAPGDWQQESGSHCLDPVPERSLSVFLGWGWGIWFAKACLTLGIILYWGKSKS